MNQMLEEIARAEAPRISRLELNQEYQEALEAAQSQLESPEGLEQGHLKTARDYNKQAAGIDFEGIERSLRNIRNRLDKYGFSSLDQETENLLFDTQICGIEFIKKAEKVAKSPGPEQSEPERFVEIHSHLEELAETYRIASKLIFFGILQGSEDEVYTEKDHRKAEIFAREVSRAINRIERAMPFAYGSIETSPLLQSQSTERCIERLEESNCLKGALEIHEAGLRYVKEKIMLGEWAENLTLNDEDRNDLEEIESIFEKGGESLEQAMNLAGTSRKQAERAMELLLGVSASYEDISNVLRRMWERARDDESGIYISLMQGISEASENFARGIRHQMKEGVYKTPPNPPDLADKLEKPDNSGLELKLKPYYETALALIHGKDAPSERYKETTIAIRSNSYLNSAAEAELDTETVTRIGEYLRNLQADSPDDEELIDKVRMLAEEANQVLNQAMKSAEKWRESVGQENTQHTAMYDEMASSSNFEEMHGFLTGAVASYDGMLRVVDSFEGETELPLEELRHRIETSREKLVRNIAEQHPAYIAA